MIGSKDKSNIWIRKSMMMMMMSRTAIRGILIRRHRKNLNSLRIITLVYLRSRRSINTMSKYSDCVHSKTYLTLMETKRKGREVGKRMQLRVSKVSLVDKNH